VRSAGTREQVTLHQPRRPTEPLTGSRSTHTLDDIEGCRLDLIAKHGALVPVDDAEE
jgi:hypothetical protein